MSDTSTRSLEHWSEDKRREMEDFYVLATGDYRHLAEAFDWKALLEGWQQNAGDRPLRLLDVACGSGKFPGALLAHADVGNAAIQPIDYALLDPSQFSIDETRRVLQPPFVAGAEHSVPLQDLDANAGPFDIVWATHALYAIPAAELPLALSRFVAVTGGTGFIAHATSDAHYLKFYDMFLNDFRGGEGEPYAAAEAIVAELGKGGAPLRTRTIHYESTAPATATAQVEGFLQRCVFDDTVTLEALMDGPTTGPYLRRCAQPDAWRFEQHVELIFIGQD
ncbi:class I SAM-dependent methyltransferase [Acuticoccus sp. MNP-M23]|uniref:class I SAM-dependent methyltransferase n=1 Tax=Acuticoccus sp. MNP-M23 TaxID=3072793 RepID=UPI0028164D57|nr:class I SAM-dependent methyltransferase [Acuticoccus sp. MNP-M23]WMS44660.1 class I SAM-dependent methyltransferase [Acuticoccus sp. MNP-M23]